MNTCTLTGNLTRDAELRFTTGGRANCSFGLATTRRYQQNGEWQEDTSFFNVVCWGDLAENVCTSVGKGDRVTVVGRLDQNTWEKDGEKKSAVQIVADEVSAAMRFATVKISKVVREKAGDATKAA